MFLHKRPRNVGHHAHAPGRVLPGEAVAQRAAQRAMLRAVKRRDHVARTHGPRVTRPVWSRAEQCLALPPDQEVGFLPRQHDGPMPRRANLEYRAVSAILLDKVLAQVARQPQAVAQERQAPVGDRPPLPPLVADLQLLQRLRGSHREQRRGDCLRGQLQPREQLDTIAYVLVLRRGKHRLEQSARVHQRDEACLARGRQSVLRSEQAGEEANVDPAFDHRTIIEPRQRPLLQRVGAVSHLPHPRLRRLRVRRRELRQRGIQQVVAQRRPVDQPQPLRIRVDAPFQSEIEQHGPSERKPQRTVGQRRHVPAPIVREQHQ